MRKSIKKNREVKTKTKRELQESNRNERQENLDKINEEKICFLWKHLDFF